MRTGEEIKKLIDANNATIEQILKPNQFTLNNIVAQLLNENKMLQTQCPHKFEDGYCIYCYKGEEK
ncbi:MAG: hypothetical protein IJH65_13535 [Methanobrevibacter sp.]|nr:hypothetical protein [Methanobrevibacter sp.]